jgi:hypothetical protein
MKRYQVPANLWAQPFNLIIEIRLDIQYSRDIIRFLRFSLSLMILTGIQFGGIWCLLASNRPVHPRACGLLVVALAAAIVASLPSLSCCSCLSMLLASHREEMTAQFDCSKLLDNPFHNSRDDQLLPTGWIQSQEEEKDGSSGKSDDFITDSDETRWKLGNISEKGKKRNVERNTGFRS